MSVDRSVETSGRHLCLHPSVSSWVGPEGLDSGQKVAAVAKVRCLEHRLFEGGRVRRDLTEMAIERLVAEINELRGALGWLEFDLEGLRRRNQMQGVGS